MKKIAFALLSLLLVAGAAFGQESPDKALKKAGRALGSYNLDPANNGAKLDEAVEMINIAGTDAEIASSFKFWQTKGEIYAALGQKDINMMVVDENHKPVNPTAAVDAAEAFLRALELAEKKYEKKDALEGLRSAANQLNFMGNYLVGQEDYANAFRALDVLLRANQTLVDNGEDPILATDEDLTNTKYVAAFCALYTGDKGTAKNMFMDLYESGAAEAGVYAQLFNFLMEEGKEEEALEVLDKGRERFPENTEILFTEINYYIQKEKYDVLEEKLKLAIEKEPDNPSVYSALGNVYMNLFTEEFAQNGESETAQQYFQSALDYFNKALELKPDLYDALYSVGSLYFNKAVELVKVMSELGMSREEQKKYEELDKASKELFNKALPYFQKAEAINPNDTNTLLALSEIYARLNDVEKAKEFKDRLQKVRDGGSNDSSYFK